MNKVISVIIPFYGDHKILTPCLEALANQTLSRESFEVIVVENGPKMSLDAFRQSHPWIHFVHESKEGSYAARNAGISVACSDLLAFTDADCIPAPNWLETLTRAFANDPTCDYLVGSIVFVHNNNRRPNFFELFDSLSFLQQKTQFEHGHYGCTANIGVRRSLIEKVGAFDSMLKSGGDREFGNRVYKSGAKQSYVENAVVGHISRKSWRSLAAKTRRLAGGRWTVVKREGGLRHLMLWATGFSFKPAIQMAQRKVEPAYTRVLLAAIAISLQVVRSLELLRLNLSGCPLR